MSEFATYAIQADWDLDGSWTDPGEDITEYFLHATINRGFANPLTRMATVGTMRLHMENEARQFSPPLESSVVPMVPIRVRMTYGATTVTRFQGFILSIEPAAGQYNTHDVIFNCADAGALLQIFEGRIVTQTGVYADDIISTVVDDVYTPPSTNYQDGINLFPTSGEQWTLPASLGHALAGEQAGEDNVRATDKIRDACTADWGRFFIAADGAPTFINRHTMPLDTSTELTMASSPTLGYRKSASDVYNWIEVTYLPRSVGTFHEVLGRFAPERAARIAPLTTETFVITFRDPSNQAIRIGGLSVVTPVSGTDYEATDDEAGEGADVSANLTLTFTAYADRAEVKLENTHSTNDAYIQYFTVRGRAVRSREPETVRVIDQTSINAYGQRKLGIRAPLMGNNAQALSLAIYLLDLYKDPQNVLRGVRLDANCDSTTLAAARDLELLDRVDISDTQVGLTNFIGHVMRLQHEIDSSGVHQVFFDVETPNTVGTPIIIDSSTLDSGHVLIY